MLALAALVGGGALVGLGAAAPAAAAPGSPVFTRTATYPVFQNSGLAVDDEAVAEISTVSPDGRTVVYTDAPNGQVGFLDITDPGAPVGLGTLQVGGEPTSVAVRGTELLICVDDTDGDFPNATGRLVVADLASRTVLGTIDLGGQPDSIALTKDGSLAAIAMENQRDEDVADGELPQAPAGTLALLDLAGPVSGWAPATVDLVPALTAIGAYGASDPEPEYVSFNADDELALTLQENNAVAVITPDRADLTASAVDAFDAGSVDVTGVDVVEDDTIDPTGSTGALPREPDAIAWVGDGLVATANEGDLFGGTRGWSVFSTATGTFGDVVFDSGNSLEHLAIAQGLYPESRSENKGVEPEGIAFAEYGGVPYAFVGSERGNFVAVYDMTDPTEPAYTQTLPTTNGPEGLLPVPARGLFVVSSETDVPEDDVRASVGLYSFGPGAAQFPTITSDPAAPVAWGALSGLTADPADPDRLYAVSDSYYAPAAIQTIDTSSEPAQVTAALEVTDTAAHSLDLEGIAARPAGGWWVVSEGDADEARPNELLQVSPAGAVVQRVALPAEVAGALGSNGLEGVAVQPGSGPEVVWVALQVPATGDAADVSRLGRYDVAAGTWSWLGYHLEPTPAGAREFVSELVAVDADTLAVIERDNRPGVFAQVKRVYAVSIAGVAPVATGAPLPIAPKTLAVDLLPALQATNGWVPEKVEGLTVGGDGQVYAVTDNDGVEDATGETVFLRLGAASTVFAGAAGDGPVVVPPTTPAPTPTPTPTPIKPTPTPSPTPGPTYGAGVLPVADDDDWDADGDASWLDGDERSGSLAYTGAEVAGLLSLGGVLLVAGAGALLLGRRRRS
ncbi:esterase-like activity of phytase family protein [Modestobacter versicolor]|uniref:Alkaline phosphatase n=1 Tax=Modestobacter versicolor TaxID=429133 RepID=A0A323VAW6_9ACTN|nr:esterase-like activity of phytase family protein [Modestobacter versicolor]PZA22022.1 alkaline phosphatase [Modestobacter versicolor]